MQVSSGRSYPLGATVDEKGINFAIFSANAEKVELCLFDASGQNELQRITLPEFTDEVWHGFVDDLPEGTLYGYRVYGPFAPHEGHRFNPHKLLLDPYAKQLAGEFITSTSHYAFDTHCPEADLTLDIRDNAAYLPKCVAVKTLALCNSHPQVRRRDTILYELHVKGFTKLHPDVPVELQGTFAGLAQPSVCQYLADLGITSIELLPVHSFLDEPFVKEKNLTNYWGYNSLSFFVPQPSYCYSDGLNGDLYGGMSEFKNMVEVFHQAGIEVILDVVYNHTAEGNELGPTLSFKGIDNASYYRLCAEDKRFYVNHSGCGNTLNISHPRVLQLVTDSLRYWVEVMGVDGFRFDLAPVLGRDEQHFSANNHFFSALKQDPTLAKVKLIAEPWDIGEGGYQLGRFPNQWMEWNDRFRDTCRRFWRGDEGMAPEFAARLHGSSDIFEPRTHGISSRRPSASINFITSHDGFTLHDLVSYQHQHNHANGEQNQDGHSSNFSSNFGVEGDTDNDIIKQLRQQQKRNLLTTLFISQGTPMLLSGDEMANSQQGNNNAYCQDNEISWLNWHNSNSQSEIEFVKRLIHLRKEHPLLNRTHYQHGNTVSAQTGLPDISWLNCHGKLMQTSDWHDSAIKCVSMLLGDTKSEVLPAVETIFGEYCPLGQIEDDALLIIFNAHQSDIDYALPALSGYWQVLLNTAEGIGFLNDKLSKKLAKTNITAAAHSCVVLSFSQTSSKENPKNTTKINQLTFVSEEDRE
ncbi:MAG: glycogen debranching protein GlgX [Colwellia sp.]|nr:glycogen debranching protein GlgX [Colwellia sp.]